MIYLVDIENIPNRYSEQWRKWHEELFALYNLEYLIIGSDENVATKKNEFMSFIPSNRYKAKQIIQLADLLNEERIKENDVVYFMDAWHPGVISLYQMRIFYPHKFKIAGFWHAGSYDVHDILGPYFKDLSPAEIGYSRCLDGNFFATDFSRTIFDNVTKVNNSSIVGFLMDQDFMGPWQTKEKMIVFPHRISPEKHPEMFDELAASMPDWNCIKTIEVAKDKKEYYSLLRRAKYSVSFAEQETFGISMVESFNCGCIPIVPNRLSYKELFSPEFRYRGPLIEVKNMIEKWENRLDDTELLYATGETYKKIKHATSGFRLIKSLKNLMTMKV
jgi:hypothetical protein